MDLKLITKPGRINYVEVWVDREFDWSHAPDESTIMEINNWVALSVQGQRTAYNGWQLRRGEDLTAFILRWQSC